MPSTEEITTSRYGVEVRVVDAAGAELCQRLRDTLPPELTVVDGAASVMVSYLVTVGTQSVTGEGRGYRVSRDGSAAFAAATEEDVFAWLCQDIDGAVAQRSPQMLFVHAGVVGWRGLAIVIPGRSHTGKSTLVAELVRRGAVYYSDEFAVLDAMGMVHPYRRPLVLRGDARPPPDLRLVPADVPVEPLPIGVVVAGSYQPGVAWRPTVVRGARAVLPLIDGTVQAREESARMLRIAARIAPGIVALQGPRPEATEVAAQLLDLVDDAFVSHALGENGSRHLSADLSRVAEMRLLSRAGRPAPPTARRLEATRYVRMPDFLDPAEHRRLLDHVLAHEDEFRESGIVGPQDELGVLDYGVRKSRTLGGPALEEIWELFERRLAGILPAVRRELGIAWFSVGKVERQLTVHGSGGFFVPHVDTGSPIVADRRISCVYYFHASPQRFTGGELKMYDTWVTPTGTTGAATHSTLAPVDNSIVFFPSDAFHEVCPVHPDSEAFGDSRFTVTIWFHEGQRPVRLDAPSREGVRDAPPVQAASEGSDLSRGAGPSEASSSGASRTPSTRPSGEVAVTYDQATTDGVGSQLHRIYGLYALSRALDVKYVHTPIGLVGYQGFLPLLSGRTDPDFTARYNAFFSLPSDDFDLESCERVRIHILSRDTVERYREHAAATGRPVLLQAIHHYGYTDAHPAAFHALRSVSPYRGDRAAGPIRVCIHLRRGDVSVPGRTDGHERVLPNSYYLRVCGAVLDALRQQGAPFVVRLHTEVPPRRHTLYPDTPGLYFWLDQPATVDPSEYTLEDFETLPNLEMVLNVEPREALDDFATADVLILSRSSLGYLGGLLNPHGLVIYAPWWHPALPDWLVADEQGNLDAAHVATRIADHLQRRSRPHGN